MTELNKMTARYLLILFVLYFGYVKSQSQEKYNPIITSAAFVGIAPDAKSTGMANIGVASAPDLYSQHHNASKYIFMEEESGLGISITPWLNELVNDMYLFHGSYFLKLNKISSFGTSFRFFKIGSIQLTDDQGNSLWQYNPAEFALDISYSLLLSTSYSMAVTARYIYSDLMDKRISNTSKNAQSVAVDISGFYQSEVKLGRRYKTMLYLGYNISNIGFKMSYNKSSDETYFIPTRLNIGSSLKFTFNRYHSLTPAIEFSKLLVPTPPIKDSNGEIIKGKDNSNLSVLSGIFQSFNDAPDGFSEEIKEITMAIGVEYGFRNSFFFRGGLFNSSEKKGNLKYINLGFGFVNRNFDLAVSYLFSLSNVRNPLENTLRFSIGYIL